MSLRIFGHTVTLTSPRSAFRNSSIKLRDGPMPRPIESGIRSRGSRFGKKAQEVELLRDSSSSCSRAEGSAIRICLTSDFPAREEIPDMYPDCRPNREKPKVRHSTQRFLLSASVGR